LLGREAKGGGTKDVEAARVRQGTNSELGTDETMGVSVGSCEANPTARSGVVGKWWF
jgi:hypothetical protein